MMQQWFSYLPFVGSIAFFQAGFNGTCESLTSVRLPNTLILSAEPVSANSTIFTPGSCQSDAPVSSNICRVQLQVNTTATSSVRLEAWLPPAEKWNGRFLGVGNGGLGGCIEYHNLDYGSAMGFVTVGSDNGHDGRTGEPFLHAPEVFKDFSHRALHVVATVGKRLTKIYYARTHSKAYYLGCSSGGRMGIKSALEYPTDFDGILAGAPAVNVNRLISWHGKISTHVGAPNAESSKSFIPPDLLPLINSEVLRQCDDLDGVLDGIITDPDACDFRPETLQCSKGTKSTEDSPCLSRAQVVALKRIHLPLYGKNSELLMPRMDPGALADGDTPILLGGNFTYFAEHWYKYLIHNNSAHEFNTFDEHDFALADEINPARVSTWDGDLSVFKKRGGKILMYHGTMDVLIPLGNSKRYYNLVSETLSEPILDDFLRLFIVPGMGHCTRGPGAWRFGQYAMETMPPRNEPSTNALLALVEWLEDGKAPDVILGTGDDGKTREHCRYPRRSMWDGQKWYCRPA